MSQREPVKVKVEVKVKLKVKGGREEHFAADRQALHIMNVKL